MDYHRPWIVGNYNGGWAAGFYDNLASFQSLMGGVLNGKAASKGYAEAEGDGRRLLDFVAQHADGHASGEIIYKVVRWRAAGNPEDLVKIAAWAFLEWDRWQRTKSAGG